jgi:hypothetical protein
LRASRIMYIVCILERQPLSLIGFISLWCRDPATLIRCSFFGSAELADAADRIACIRGSAFPGEYKKCKVVGDLRVVDDKFSRRQLLIMGRSNNLNPAALEFL